MYSKKANISTHWPTRTNLIRYSLILFLALFVQSVLAQTDQEFWFVAPEVNNDHGGGGSPSYIRLTAYDIPTTVTISQPGNPSFTNIVVSLLANETKSVEFQKNGGGAGVYDLNLIENTMQRPRPGRVGNINNVGIKISSTANITAYYEISSDYNREIITLKGRNAVGKEFFVPFQTNFDNYDEYDLVYSAIDILAIQATTVNIKPTVDMLLLDASGDVIINAGNTYQVNLNMGETFQAVPYGLNENTPYNISRTKRLAGTRVWSNDSALVVQTKDDLVKDYSTVLCNGCDHDIDYVADQLVPTNLIGKKYVVMTGQINTVPEYVYILATVNNTEVFLNGVSQGTIAAQTQKDIRIDNLSSNFNLIETTEPVYVYHVSGFAGQMGGSILPQIDVCTGSQEVTFTRPKGSPFDFYMNILVRDGAQNNFRLNGSTGQINPTGGWTEVVPGEWWAGTVDATSLISAQTPQVLSNTDVFHLGIINGNGSYDCFYGYFSDFAKLDISATIVGTINGAKVICYGKSTQLIASKGNSYSWTADDTPYYIDDPTAQSPFVFPLETRKYKVVVEGGCNIKDSSYVDIIVSDPIEASFTLSDVVGCAPMQVGIANHSEDNYAVKDYKWYVDGDATIDYTTGPDTLWHTYNNTTNTPITYEIKLITENTLRCKDSLYADVTVHPEINANFAPDTTGCNPLTVPFRNLSNGNTGTFAWKFGDGGTSVAENPTHTYNNLTGTNQQYEVQLITKSPSFYCKDTITKIVEVEPALYAIMDIDVNMGCSPLTITPQNASSPTSIDNYEWIWGDGDTTKTENPGSHTYTNVTGMPITRTLKLVATRNGCTDTTATPITIYSGVTAALTPSTILGCHPVSVDFTDNSTGIITDQKWYFGDGTVLNNTPNPTHTFNNYGLNDTTFNVQLIVTTGNGCRDTTEQNITVHPYINAKFTPNFIKGCANLDITLINKSAGAINTYQWDWGDGSPTSAALTPGTHTYLNGTSSIIYDTIQLIVDNIAGCKDTANQPIEIYPVADATFTAAPLSGCNPLTVDFKHTPVNAVPVELTWEFGDNTSGANSDFFKTYSHFNNTPTSFDVSLIAQTAKGCSDTVETSIEVGPYYNIAYTLDTAAGCSPFTINPINTSTGGIDSWTWKKEDIIISNAQNPGHITLYNNTNSPIDTVLTLIGSNSAGICKDSIQRTITIYPSLDATIEFDASTGCNPLTVNFSNNETATDATWRWNFGDGGSSNQQNPVHIFENTNNTSTPYTTQLIVSTASKCADTATQTITVASLLNANFTVNKSAGCSPLTIFIEDETIGEVTSRKWRKNDVVIPSTSATTEITLYNNSDAVIDTTIWLIVENSGPGNCKDSIGKTITIYPSLNATFITDITGGCTPLSVNFTNSEGASNVTWAWSFGDGHSSTLQNPTNEYINSNYTAQAYTAQLILKSTYDCADTTTQTITLASKIEPKFTVDKSKGCSPLTIQLQNESLGDITSFTWKKEDIPFSTSTSPQITLYNTTDAVIDTTIWLIIKNDGPGLCKDSISQTITIYPSVDAAFVHAPVEGCNPLTVDFTNTETNPTVTWEWQFGDGDISNAQNPQHTFNNDINTAKTYTTQLIVNSMYNCADTTTQTVTVASHLVANFSINKATGCSPLTIELKDESIGEITQRTWHKNGDLLNTNSANPLITLYNNTDAPIDTIISLTVSNNGPGTCSSTISRTVTIYPSVDATFTNNISNGCNPLTVNFTNLETNNEVNWLWDFGDNHNSTVQNPTHTFTNTNSTPVNYDVKLKLITPYGCSDSVTNTITVGQNFTAAFEVDKVSGCSPFLLQFNNISTGTNLAYSWLRNETTFSGATNPNLTITNTTASVKYDTIKLAVTTSGSITCSDTISKIIKTYPEVDATFTHSITEGCNPLEINFAHTPILPINVDYYWDFGDNSNSYQESPTHTFYNDTEQAQTFDIKLIVESTNGGCKDSISSSVEVASRIDANFQLTDAAGCSPFTTSFTDASFGDITNYQWYINDITHSTLNQANTTLTNTTNANLTNDIKLVVTNAGPGICKDSITRTITAYPEVIANFTLDTARGCNPLTVNFEHQPGENTVNVNFDWDFGDNTTSDEQDPQHIFEHFNYNETSSFEINLTTTSEYGCTDEHQESVTVEKALKAEFAIDPSAGCAPFHASFDNTSKGADQYFWTYGDGETFTSNILQDVNHKYTNSSYINPATYQASLRVINTNGNCEDIFNQTITVYPKIHANFEANTQEGCHPVIVNFTNNSQGDANYFWDFNDQTSSTQTNPTHTFKNTSNTNDQYFNVNLTATNEYECVDDTAITIRVNHNPRTLFEIDETASCSPLQIIATNNSVGADNYEWRLGNGETNQNNPLNYSYNNTSGEVLSYKLELYTETNKNCKDSTSLMLNVYPQVQADFNITNAQDCNPLITGFENLSENADNYYWDFGEGTTSNQYEPNKRFEITGYENENIPIKLISSSAYNCVDSITKHITVYVQPAVDFELNPILQQFPENTVNITDLTNGGPFNYLWNFGDGNTSTEMNPSSHDYATWGTFNINLLVTNQNFDCTDELTSEITILPPEVTAEFEISDTAGCMPHTATFTAKASQHADDQYTYFWDFGDGTTSNEQTPTHTYDTAGSYTIILTVVGDNGSIDAYSSITVYPLPLVNFTMDPLLVMIPGDKTQCYNHTTYGKTYLWNFGDGLTSEEVSPSHYYTNIGVYDVTLTATSKLGCVASLTLNNYIDVRGKGEVVFPNAFTPSIAGPSDGSYSETDTDNDIFHPHVEGVVEYHLYIYNRWGEMMFESKDVNIGWDGYYNGQLCPQDVYIWKVNGKYINGKNFEQTGDVTLLR